MIMADSPVWVVSKWAIYADWFAAFGTWAGVVVTVLTLFFLWKQLRLLKEQVEDLRDSVHSATYQNVYELMISIDRFFIEHRELKPYFYPATTGGCHIYVNPDELASAAEMMLDYFDCVYHQRATMPENTFRGFSKFMRSVYEHSAPLKELVNNGGRENWYPRDFIRHLTGEK